MTTTAYIDPPDIPEGMTIAEYRRTRPLLRPQRGGFGTRLRRRGSRRRAAQGARA